MSVFRRRLLTMFSAGLGKIDMVNGSVVITATGYTQGDATEETPYIGDYVITQGSASEITSAITVDGIADGKVITLNGVKMNHTNTAIDVKSGEVVLNISGTNTLRCSQTSNGLAAGGLAVRNGAKAIVKGSGTLNTTGNNRCAGIYVEAGGVLQIDSGKIVAYGGTASYEAAGIGGRGYSGNVGTIIINGGDVTADGGGSSSSSYKTAAIGASSRTTAQMVEINGGRVNAKTETPDLIASIKATVIEINGGNIICNAYPDVSNKTLTKLYFVSAGAAMANTEVTITEGEHTWSALTDDNGCVTTYLAVDGNGASSITYNGYDYTITGGSLTIEVN